MKLPFNSVISGLALMVILGFTQCAGRHHGTSREESTVEVGQQSYQKLEPLRVNFYLERSGSMTPYDSPRGDGSFKAAFVSMLNSVPGDANRLYIVNDSIYRYPKGIRQFISDDNIFASSKGIGDPSYTDFQRIFQAILENTEKNEISVLFTDMIYSVKTMEGTNPRKIFSDATGMISSVFKQRVGDMSLLVVQMQGSYDGAYYPYNSPFSGQQYTGVRPYYIIVAGNRQAMKRLEADDRYAAFCDFTRLKGYRDMYLYQLFGNGSGSDKAFIPYSEFMLSHEEIRGRFKPDSDNLNCVTGLEADKETGNVRLALAVDLGRKFILASVLTNPANYAIDRKGVKIEKIISIDKTKLSKPERNRALSATHIFILKVSDIASKEEVTISLPDKLADWIGESNSDDDTNLSGTKFSKTTFGLKYILEGIYDSYRRTSVNSGWGEPCYFKIKLILEK